MIPGNLMRFTIRDLLYLAVIAAVAYAGFSRPQPVAQPTQTQMRIHEGILDHHAVRDVVPTIQMFEELSSRREIP